VAVAERVRLKFAGLRFATGGEPIGATCSLGVAAWRSGDSIDTLLRRADMALYRAKSEGRNRVVAEDDGPTEAEPRATDGRIRSTQRDRPPAGAGAAA